MMNGSSSRYSAACRHPRSAIDFLARPRDDSRHRQPPKMPRWSWFRTSDSGSSGPRLRRAVGHVLGMVYGRRSRSGAVGVRRSPAQPAALLIWRLYRRHAVGGAVVGPGVKPRCANDRSPLDSASAEDNVARRLFLMRSDRGCSKSLRWRPAGRRRRARLLALRRIGWLPCSARADRIQYWIAPSSPARVPETVFRFPRGAAVRSRTAIGYHREQIAARGAASRAGDGRRGSVGGLPRLRCATRGPTDRQWLHMRSSPDRSPTCTRDISTERARVGRLLNPPGAPTGCVVLGWCGVLPRSRALFAALGWRSLGRVRAARKGMLLLAQIPLMATAWPSTRRCSWRWGRRHRRAARRRPAEWRVRPRWHRACPAA